MITKTKIALAAALVLGSASVALADGEFDGNLQNRYPQAVSHGWQSRNVGLTTSQTLIQNESYIDRASQSSGGGY